MNDDQIRSELERRASSAASAPDWTKRALLPAVWREIEARPQPVVTSRGPSFAGAAAVVVALLVLVVAVPRLVPQPPSSSASPSEAASLAPAEPMVLSADDFIALLAARELRGQTVLVDGHIEPGPTVAQGGPPCTPPSPCPWGLLPGSPNWTIYARDFAVPEGDGGTPREGATWSSWSGPTVPVSGTFVLSVQDDGLVVFEGLLRPAADALSWSVSDAAALDPAEISADTTVLVRGRLTSVGVDRDCISVPRRPAGLPIRACQRLTAIVSTERGDGGMLLAQPDALGQFGAREGLYAISPRLYGGYCETLAPCWLWDIVARVDDAPTPEPTPAPTSEIAPSPSPTSPLSAVGTDRAETGGASFVLTVTADRTDYTAGEPIEVSSSLRSETDVTVSCLSWPSISLEQLDGDLEFSPGPFISRCTGERELHSGEELVADFLPAVWAEASPNPLDPYIRDGRLYLPPGTYRFSAHSSLSVGGLDQLGQQRVQLEAAVVINVAPEQTPVETGARTIGCEGSETLGDPGIALIDHSGRVSGCFVEEAQSAVPAGPFELTSTDRPARLAATWAVNLYCPTDDQLEFWGPLDEPVGGADYVMQLVRVRSQTSEVPGDACDVVTFRTVEVEFTDPISPRDILGLAVDKSIADNTVSASASEGSFQLKLSAPAVSPANQPIDVTSSLTYQGTGQVTLSGWWTPNFAFASLTDGPNLPPYGHLLLCPDAEVQLRPGEPVLGTLDGGMEVTPEDPNYAYRSQYAYDGKFRLPDGSYLIYTGVGFNVGSDCTGDSVHVRTAIVIRVGLESVVEPTEPASTAADCSETFLLLDRTGLVESCSEWTPAPGESGVSQGPDASTVFVAWTYTYCRGAPFARFEHDGDRYVFELGHFVRLPMPTPSCEPVTRTVGIAVRFTQPLDVGLIDVSVR